MNKHYTQLTAVLLSLITLNVSAQFVSSFESFNLSSNTVKNGSGAPVDGKFNSGKVEFPNTYQTDYAYWSNGWAYSTMQDDTTGNYTNLYSVITKTGNNGSVKYGVGQQNSVLRITGIDAGKPVKGLYITNGTYPALSMKNGDNIAKKFGGTTGNDPDFFVVTIKKYFNGIESTDSVNCYLSDFRFANTADDYILNTWKWVDLTSLGNVDSLTFHLTSSDNGQFGINTPTFFCIDDILTDSDTANFENLTLAPNRFWNKRNTKLTSLFKDSFATYQNTFNVSNFGDYWSGGFAVSTLTDTTTAGYGNLYSCYAGKGVDSSKTYAIAQQKSSVTLKYPTTVTANSALLKSIYVTNSTYAALSMKNGDAFAKKFGGVTGNDSDFFILTIKGYHTFNKDFIDSVNVYLADFRFADNSKDYIVKDWIRVDLSKLYNADSLVFSLTSSDVGQFGMNTPAFFAIDNLSYKIIGGLKSNDNNLTINMYPNPANTQISFSIDEKATVNIMDLNGRLLLAETINPNYSTLNIETLQTGMYIVRIETAEGVAIQKLIKQ